MDEVVHDVYTTMANTKVPHFALAIVWSFLRDRAARVASLVALESDSFTIDYSSPGSKVRVNTLSASFSNQGYQILIAQFHGCVHKFLIP